MDNFTRDPLFLRIYHSGDKEWPGYEESSKDSNNASLPVLISEIFRFIPNVKNGEIKFHAKNMPTVEINKIEIIGIVTRKTVMRKYTAYTVDDSTGVIDVLIRNKVVETYESALSTDEPFVDGEPCAKAENPTRDEIELYDYIHTLGFCAMNIRNQEDEYEVSAEEFELGKIFFYGFCIRSIDEEEHNTMMVNLITDLARKRYLEPNT